MRLGEYIHSTTQLLIQAGVDSPRLCAQLLAGHVLGLDRLHCVLAAERELTPTEADALSALTARRATGEPLAHILGQREFFGRNFLVTPDTLIPRPETELLVESALELLPADEALDFADLGTGTGCIGVTLCLERPQWQGLLLEISPAALIVARKNAARLGAAPQISVMRADLHSLPLREGACRLIVSNPPYIAAAERGQVMNEVLHFEPHSALFSPQSGLSHLQAVITQAARALCPGGLLLLEHGATQGREVRAHLSAAAFKRVCTRQDLAGLERCTLGWKA